MSTDVLLREHNEIEQSLPRNEFTPSHLTEVVEHFDQMNLHESLLRVIYDFGLERPTDVQQRALKPCISGSIATVSLKLKCFSINIHSS